MKKKKAFSLVEILVALIIVSLITAALAPVITKKLSSAGVTIVGGASGGGGGDVEVESGDGMCTTCEDGFMLQGNQCVTANFSFEFNGGFADTVNNLGYQKIYLKSSGTFKPKVTKKGKLFLVGAGGGGAGSYAGGGGGGGYAVETNFTFEKDVPYVVTIGTGSSGGNGGNTVFGTNTANGGKAGSGKTGGAGQGAGGTESAGGAGYTFDGTAYGGGGGAGRYAHAGGSGGGGKGGDASACKGLAGRPNTGGGGGGSGGDSSSSYRSSVGGSGVVIILFEENSSTTKEPIQKPCREVNGDDYICTPCPVGYTLSGTKCLISPFEYTYTGSYGDATNSYGYQKITLKGSGIFKSKVDKRVRMLLVGAGGGGAGAYAGGGGGGGLCNETYFTLKANTEYNVTIGAGSTGNGGATSFGTNRAEGGLAGSGRSGGTGQGYGGTYGVQTNGGAGCTFDGIAYGGGGGCGRWSGSGGSGGGGAGGSASATAGTNGTANRGGGGGGSGGDSSATYRASSGGSGVIVILVEESPSSVLDPNQCDVGTGGSGGSGGGGTTLKTNCGDIDSNCQLCTASKCLVCKNKYDLVDGVCQGEAEVDVNTLVNHPITTSCTGVDENCTSCTDSACLTCADGYVLDNGVCLEEFRTGEPQKQADCDPYFAWFVPKEVNGAYGKNICITTRTVGYHSGPEVFIGAYDSKILTDAGAECTHPDKRACCWRGNITGGFYGSVCGFTIASSSCKNHNPDFSSWNLPREDLVNAWIDSYSTNDEFRALIDSMFCVAWETYATEGRTMCETSYKCIGAPANECIPARIWARNGQTFELLDTLKWMSGSTEYTAARAFCVSSNVPIR